MQAFFKIHPAVTMIYFLAILLISMFVNNPVINLISLLGAGVFLMLIAGVKRSLSDVKFYIPLLLLVAVTNPLFSHNGNTLLFKIFDISITFEALIYGVAFSVILLTVILWCKNYNIVMTSDKFIYLFGKAVPKLSLIITMSLRFVPMLKRQMHSINRTQKAIGLYSAEKYTDKIRTACNVLSVLIGWSLENAVEVARSMKARGYGLKGHTNYSIYKFSKKDIVILIVMLILIALTLAGFSMGYTDFEYYPELSRISNSIGALTTYISFALFAFLPTIIEVEENLRWSFYKSKI